MRLLQCDRSVFINSGIKYFTAISAVALVFWLTVPKAYASISWDSQSLTMGMNPAGSGTQWWFDPFNWTAQHPASPAPYYLPPMNESGTGVTDTVIGSGTATLPGGEGVVYDPSPADPNFANAGSLTYPAGFGPQILNDLSVSRQATAADNLLTIKGNLTLQTRMYLGRSSNVADVVATGRVNQLSGTVKVNSDRMEIGSTDTSANVTSKNYGNGIYDYSGGILEVSQVGGAGIQLSTSSSTVGAAGIGRFIMRNPSTPGYVRAYDYNAAAGAGAPVRLADGVNTGVGITEFHYANGNTRPIQVNRNLIINNGLTNSGTGAGGTRSSRLALMLDAAPSVDGSGVPQNLGLFDVAYSDNTGTSTTGAGTLGDFFSSADGSTLYTQGATVSATYLGSTYNWTISYTGNIVWDDKDLGTLTSISDMGGVDVVLKGLSSVIVPAGVTGDYNNNGVVDAADYVLWRNGGPLQNDPTPGVQPADYDAWKANFGKIPGSGSSLTAVPEPTTIVFALIGVLGTMGLYRRGKVGA